MILCCGEALIDMIPSRNASGEPGFTPLPGGAVFNTAISLGRLGVRTGFVGGLSNDLFGDQLRTALTKSGVDSSCCEISDLPTTLAFVQLKNGQATYSFYDEKTAASSLSPDQLPEIPTSVSTLFFGGISLASEPSAEFFDSLAVRESASRVIVLDPNIRADFISNEATYRARLGRMISLADILKVSDEDLNWIIPGPNAIDEKIAKIHAMGPKLVFLTRGSESATAIMPDCSRVDTVPEKVEVVDTVGAGDTFNAGILAKLIKGGHLTKTALGQLGKDEAQAALEFGIQVAAITVSRRGANPPWGRELLPSGLE